MCFVCGLTYAQESFTDSVRLVKENYINVFIGNDPAKKALVDRLAEVPKEKEASDQNVIELQQLYPISREEVNRLVESIRDDGSWVTSIMRTRNVRDGVPRYIRNGFSQ